MERLDYYEIFLISLQVAGTLIYGYLLFSATKRVDKIESFTDSISNNPEGAHIPPAEITQILGLSQDILNTASMFVLVEFVAVLILYMMVEDYICVVFKPTRGDKYVIGCIFVIVEGYLFGTWLRIQDIYKKLCSVLKT